MSFKPIYKDKNMKTANHTKITKSNNPPTYSTIGQIYIFKHIASGQFFKRKIAPLWALNLMNRWSILQGRSNVRMGFLQPAWNSKRHCDKSHTGFCPFFSGSFSDMTESGKITILGRFSFSQKRDAFCAPLLNNTWVKEYFCRLGGIETKSADQNINLHQKYKHVFVTISFFFCILFILWG